MWAERKDARTVFHSLSPFLQRGEGGVRGSCLDPNLGGDLIRYCGGIFAHAAMMGLLAGTGLRQVAVRPMRIEAGL